MGQELGAKKEVYIPGSYFDSKVLEIVQTLSAEVSPNYLKSQSVRLESDLDRDLGLDSLARAELIFRIDKEFGVKLPDNILVEATTPLDILDALRKLSPGVSSRIKPSKPVVSNLELVDAPINAETLIDVLSFHVEKHRDRPHLDIWISENRLEQVTYGELHEAALKVSLGLITFGILPGDRVAIMLGTSREFFESFWGVLYSGAIPVPIYPPFRPSQVEDHLRRQAGILQNAGTKLLIISKEMKSIGSLLFDLVAALENITTASELTREGTLGRPIQADGTTIALMQYTSGSTGDPKGVVLTHANLVANIRAMGQALEAGSFDVFVSWLPLYHDMGLIGAWLGSLYFGAFAVIMPPLAFLADPSRWLRIIHRYKATLSAGPNFAFELCCRNIRDEQIEGLDLSSLRLVVNGAEPVSPRTIENFCTRFAPYGFRSEMMGPVYGLAENSVGLAFPPLGRTPIVDRVQRNLLTMEGRAVPAEDNDLTALSFVACGRPLPGHEVRIVDENGYELPDRCEGELHFRGPSATSGYFRNQEKNESLFLDSWLVSGDRAYIDKGDIYITGRIKDMIIKAGRNIYPQEIEDIVGRMEGARKGCVAAISSMDTDTKSESLILVVETRLTEEPEREKLRKQIAEACTLKLETPPDLIELVQPRTIPKTSSGKIRRAATRDLYEAGLLSSDQKRLWFQLLRLWISGLANKFRRYIHSLKKSGFGLYWWLCFLFLATITWLAVILLPYRKWRQSIVKSCAKLFLQITRTVPIVIGAGEIPTGKCIFVANHSSYIDSLVLMATLTGNLAFVAKEELARQTIAGPFLRRLGTIFVRRADVSGSLDDTDALIDAADQGERMVIYPEATLTRMPGLLPFRLGAFLVAAKTGMPIVPIVLRGTRAILRGGQWFPHRGPIRVWVGSKVVPDGSDFNSAIQLRDRVRAVVLEHCDEPDLSREWINFSQLEAADIDDEE